MKLKSLNSHGGIYSQLNLEGHSVNALMPFLQGIGPLMYSPDELMVVKFSFKDQKSQGALLSFTLTVQRI